MKFCAVVTALFCVGAANAMYDASDSVIQLTDADFSKKGDYLRNIPSYHLPRGVCGHLTEPSVFVASPFKSCS
jgi:hypothetical protein